MTPVELEFVSDADLLKSLKSSLEAKLDAFNQDHTVCQPAGSDTHRDTCIKNIKRKLNFINKKM